MQQSDEVDINACATSAAWTVAAHEVCCASELIVHYLASAD